MSGAPLNITRTVLWAESTASATSFRTALNRPDLVSAFQYPHTVTQWFNPRSFAAPASGTWGNLPRRCLRGPGRQNWNMSLFKNFVISECVEAQFQFRADAFNIWNHTQFRGDIGGGGISTTLDASNFGQVTSAYDPRMLQLGAKLCSKFSVLIGSLCFTFPCSHLPVRTGFLFSNQRKRLALRLSQKTLGC